MRRCKRCASIWVCWNWLDMTSPESVNPNQEWLHECWNCAATEVTNGKILNGIPYWILKYVGRYFVDTELFERSLAEDMAAISKDFDDWE